MAMYVFVNKILIMSVTRSNEPECFSAKNKEIADQTEPTVGIQVQGRLKRYIEYWEQVLKAPDDIIESIRNGYVLPLFSSLSPYMGYKAVEHCY